MFDFGFSELMIIAVVALIVVGPERLPKLARTVGHFIGRAQRYVQSVKADIQREVDLDELKKLQAQVEASARELETSVRGHASEVRDAASLLKEQLEERKTAPPAQGAHSLVEVTEEALSKPFAPPLETVSLEKPSAPVHDPLKPAAQASSDETAHARAKELQP
jgi:sec-independent protein translocase protein TatB